MKMIKRAGEIIRNTAGNGKGGIKLALSDLKDFPGINEKLGMFSLAEIGEGEMVDFHLHGGDAELYYILEGKGLYDDNGEKVEVEAGTVTYTPNGCGHSLKNIGEGMLKFIALIIKE